jgi:hypothetical protein
VSVVIEDALRSHLSESSLAKSTPFHLHTVRGKLVNPHLDLDRTSALLTMDDEDFYVPRKSKVAHRR